MTMQLIEHLMRGGQFGHYWFKQSKRTQWWPVSEPPDPPMTEEDAYFGVHPSLVRKGPKERVTAEDIAAINCVYADIDSKHFQSKTQAADHIKMLNPLPSAIIDSGGGYHCYWLLSDTFILNTPLKREIAQSLQERWVDYVGGDPAVHDLSRILRLPGTLNYKYAPPRQVRIAYLRLTQTYDLAILEELLPQVDDHKGGGEDGKLEVPGPAVPNRLSMKEILALADASVDAGKFKSLWQGYSEGYESSSEADLALCCMLAFWTGGDYAKIDKMFRTSGRMRGKWEREDYRHTTILKALGQVTEFYTDPGGFLSAGANDEGNAQCVHSRYKRIIAYCEALGWVNYRRTHWVAETAESTVERVIVKTLRERRAAASLAGQEIEEKRREAIIRATKPSASNVRNCKTLLRSLVTVPVADFDMSLDELNCPNGVLNLRTGQLEPHAPERRFTYCVGARYLPDADQSFWRSWLLEAVGGDQDVFDFMQMAIGYSLTGHTREETMFYVFGPARAGKGTFTETILTLLGGRPLATEVGMEMFIQKRNPSDQGFDLASLKSARFVAASESSESYWLDAAKLKRWTGSNWITCAHKYGKPFTYRPQFKIWLSSNWELQMDADDSAGWARVQVIEFPNSYLGKEDKTLKEYMRTPEILEGVFAWAVEGAVKWYELPKGGLRAPGVIKERTEATRANLDWVAQWVSEEVEITGDPEDRIPSATYYSRYTDWCSDQGVLPKKQLALNKTLKRAGYLVGELFRYEGRVGRGWIGAQLKGESFREQLQKMKFEEEED